MLRATTVRVVPIDAEGPVSAGPSVHHDFGTTSSDQSPAAVFAAPAVAIGADDN